MLLISSTDRLVDCCIIYCPLHTIKWNEPSVTKSVKIKKKVLEIHRSHAHRVPGAWAWRSHSTIQREKSNCDENENGIQSHRRWLDLRKLWSRIALDECEKNFNSIPLILSIVTRYSRCFLLLAHIINYYPIRTQCSFLFLVSLRVCRHCQTPEPYELSKTGREKERNRLNHKGTKTWALWSVRVLYSIQQIKTKHK